MKTKRKPNPHFKTMVILPSSYQSGRDTLEINQRNILPDGDIIGWKACRSKSQREGKTVLVKLLIPANARRICPAGERKCRAEYARVLWVQGGAAFSWSSKAKTIKYVAGKTVRPSNGFNKSQSQCGAGINFFISKVEALRFAALHF